MTVLLGYPLKLDGTVTVTVFSAATARKQGASPAKRSPEGTSGTLPCLQGVVCYTLVTPGRKKPGAVFLTAGWLDAPKEAGKPTPARRRLWGVLPKGDRGGGYPKPAVTTVTPVTRRAGLACFTLPAASMTDAGGRFTPTGTRLPDERNQPALFSSSVLITDMVVCKKRGAVLVEPLGKTVGGVSVSSIASEVPSLCRASSLSSCINATSRKRTGGMLSSCKLFLPFFSSTSSQLHAQKRRTNS